MPCQVMGIHEEETRREKDPEGLGAGRFRTKSPIKWNSLDRCELAPSCYFFKDLLHKKQSPRMQRAQAVMQINRQTGTWREERM